MSRIISFRGLLPDGEQESIPLATIRGLIGYKIVKFDIMPESVNNAQISTVQIFSIRQGTPTTAIDFSDQTLLGVAVHQNNSSTAYPWSGGIFFDNIIFNQDIYITHQETGATDPINWYIELAQMPLALDEATVATLKDIRNND
jgi:hypothetical protein